ncbi:MAG TPA: hypothetical protein VLS93_18790 [Anaeromyxobacteraceae bacterium]|nr:hypothetical protein [Anaeromyxobacteraceae bacterium]
MIHAVLVELDAVVDAGRARPGVREALAALRSLEVGAGRPLAVGLVDGGLGVEGVLERWQEAGLGDVPLDPAAIATAAVAGAAVPDRRLFQAALRRLGAPAKLDGCAIVLGDARHADACRSLRMAVLALGADFVDWRDVPLLLALRLDRPNLRNLAAALGPRLAPDLVDVSVVGAEAGRILARAARWTPLRGGRIPEGVHVAIPTEVVVRLDPAGRPSAIEAAELEPEALAEAASHVEGLFARGEVAETGRPGPGATHVLETDGRGRRLLRRARFYC